jgi:tRNA (Thr-GGU) A37 N-methylase
MSEIVFKPIGQVKTQSSESDIRAEHKDLEGELEIYAEFEPALEGIDGYSHLFVLGYFDRLRPDQISDQDQKLTA